MDKRYLIGFLFFLFVFVGNIKGVLALPTIKVISPVNGSFTKSSKALFEVEIESTSLNTSSVFVHIISKDNWIAGNPWNDYQLDCFKIEEGKYICNKTIYLSIAGTSTLEYYYFEAEDSEGRNSVGNQNSPLNFVVDVFPPQIDFNIRFAPDSSSTYHYVSNSCYFFGYITDDASGVNLSSIKYKLDYENEWKNMKCSMDEGKLGCTICFDVSNLQNNERINISYKVLDNSGNLLEGETYVLVDKELPSLEIQIPKSGSEVFGIFPVKVYIRDYVSGFGTNPKSKLEAEIISSHYLFTDCTPKYAIYEKNELKTVYEAICEATINASEFVTGEYTITVKAKDMADNEIKNSTKVLIRAEKKPFIIYSPKANGVYNDYLVINLTFLNVTENTQGLEFRISGPGVLTSWKELNKWGEFYFYNESVKELLDGIYTLEIREITNAESFQSTSVNFIVDRTSPLIYFKNIPKTVKGFWNFSFDVYDNLEVYPTSEIWINDKLLNKISCLISNDKKHSQCIAKIDTSKLDDGRNFVRIVSYDIGKNEVEKNFEILVDNKGPELIWLKINPIVQEKRDKVFFYITAVDNGSDVKSIEAKIYDSNLNSVVNIECSKVNENNTYGCVYYPPFDAIFYVDIKMIDLNENENKCQRCGVFKVGKLKCGNGICEKDENYCLCKSDCKANCKEGELVNCDSGFPKCTNLYTLMRCGDSICSGDETCETCPIDCGKCENFPVESKIPILKNFGSKNEILNKLIEKFWVFIGLGIGVLILIVLVKFLSKIGKKPIVVPSKEEIEYEY